MPLEPGKKNIGPNIATEENRGKPHDQALAIALRVAGVPPSKDKTPDHVRQTAHYHNAHRE